MSARFTPIRIHSISTRLLTRVSLLYSRVVVSIFFPTESSSDDHLPLGLEHPFRLTPKCLFCAHLSTSYTYSTHFPHSSRTSTIQCALVLSLNLPSGACFGMRPLMQKPMIRNPIMLHFVPWRCFSLCTSYATNY